MDSASGAAARSASAAPSESNPPGDRGSAAGRAPRRRALHFLPAVALIAAVALPLRAADAAPAASPVSTAAEAPTAPASPPAPPPEVLPLHRYFYQTWSAGSGLPQISVNDVVYDAEGALWVATENGLARFDGSRFEVFDNATHPELASSWVTRLHRDQEDRIWIATVNNVARWENGRFVAVPGADSSLGHVTGIVEGPDGHILVGGDHLLRQDGDRLVADSSWSGSVRALLRQGDVLWIAGQGGRLVRRERGREQELHLPAPAAQGTINRLAWAQGRLWIGTSVGLYSLTGSHFTPLPLSSDDTPAEVLALATDRDDVLWVGAYTGLYRVARGAVIDRPQPGDPSYLSWVISLFADSNGGIWVGSRQSGLRYLWRIRAERLAGPEGLRDPNVWSFWADRDGILVGSNGGVDLLRSGRFRPVVDGSTLGTPAAAYSVLRDRAGSLWVGLRSGLHRYSSDLREHEEIPQLHGLQVNGLLESDPGALWVASSGGLFHVGAEGARLVPAESGLSERRIRFVMRDRQGTLWAGTENGLFAGRDGRYARETAEGLGETFITALLELTDGRLVVASNDRGLFVRGTGGWRRLMPEQGLPSTNAFFLGEHAGALVVGFRDGVYRTPIAGLERASASAPLAVDMLLLDEGERVGRSRIRCCNGAGNGKGLVYGDAIWLPSLGGVVHVPLESPAEAPPRARITGLTQQEGRLAPAARVRLQPGSRDVEIHYGAIDFRYAGQLRYRYRMQGYVRDWSDVGDRAVAIYTNLPPGKLRFEVQARRVDQTWGPPATMEVEVPRRLIETWPVRLLLAALLVLAVWLVARWRIERLRRQKAQLEAIVEARTRELQGANARLEAMNLALVEASVTDPLTGLHNRRFIREEIPAALARLARARSASGQDLVVGALVLDLDHFKAVNDTYGHAVGDRVLQSAAEALRAAVRAGDMLMRWGGEEFLVVVTDVERSELGGIAERLRASVAVAGGGTGAPSRLSASLGFAAYPLRGIPEELQSWQSVLDLADHALYGAKAAGRDRSATIVVEGMPPGEWPEHVRASQVETWYAEGKARLVVIGGSGAASTSPPAAARA